MHFHLLFPFPLLQSMERDPQFQETYKTLFRDLNKSANNPEAGDNHMILHDQLQLPIIDLNRLISDKKECVREIGEAATEWGFFQVVNHEISRDILERVREEQERLFMGSLENKSNYLAKEGCYRWGNLNATSVMQFSWSEAFHIPLSHTSVLSPAIEEFSEIVSKLAQTIAAILAENLNEKSLFFAKNCLPSSCYLRLNRYPKYPFSPQIHGLIPHTDSDFLTVLYQDNVGGLQLIKNGEWMGVKPNPDALIINIGDIFQAWSNGVYKSIKHRVVTNGEKERYSIAYFLCPSYDTVIQPFGQFPWLYKRFTFGEYRKKVQEDVKSTGTKTGLQGFLA